MKRKEAPSRERTGEWDKKDKKTIGSLIWIMHLMSFFMATRATLHSVSAAAADSGECKHAHTRHLNRTLNRMWTDKMRRLKLMLEVKRRKTHSRAKATHRCDGDGDDDNRNRGIYNGKECKSNFSFAIVYDCTHCMSSACVAHTGHSRLSQVCDRFTHRRWDTSVASKPA